MNIKDKNKPAILAALYNNSKVQGMGWLQAKTGEMTEQEAAELLRNQESFDYLHGKVMKIDLSSDELNPRLYDRDNGEGAALRAIKHLL